MLRLLHDRGTGVDFLHIDAWQPDTSTAREAYGRDMIQLSDLAARSKIPFGVIIWGADGDADTTYSTYALRNAAALAHTFRGWDVMPQHVIIQSWALSSSGEYAISTVEPAGDGQLHAHLARQPDLPDAADRTISTPILIGHPEVLMARPTRPSETCGIREGPPRLPVSSRGSSRSSIRRSARLARAALPRAARCASRRPSRWSTTITTHSRSASLPTSGTSEAIVSLAVFARGVNLYFIHGAKLADPLRSAAGKGNQGRYVRLERAAQIDESGRRSAVARSGEDGKDVAAREQGRPHGDQVHFSETAATPVNGPTPNAALPARDRHVDRAGLGLHVERTHPMQR